MIAIRLLLLLAVTLVVGGRTAAADEIFSFGLEVTGDISNNSLTFGMDSDATDGFDLPTTYLLDIEAPPAPPGDSNNIYFVNAASTPSNLTQDIRGDGDAATWTLYIDLDTEVDGTAGLAAQISWLAPVGAFWDDKSLYLDLGGGQQVDMLAETSHTVNTSVDAFIRLITIPEPGSLLLLLVFTALALLRRPRARDSLFVPLG
jgi:hypothetical protein